MATITKSVVKRALKVFRDKQPQHIPDQSRCTCDGCVQAMDEAIGKVMSEIGRERGYHRPVCAACQLEMRPERIGVGLLDMAAFGPYHLWDADLYECPGCGHQIVAGFGDNPISRHFEDDFTRMMGIYNENSIVIESR